MINRRRKRHQEDRSIDRDEHATSSDHRASRTSVVGQNQPEIPEGN